MGLRIGSSAGSLSSLRLTTTELGRSFGRLASGLRIQTAADDAAGLGVSERMRASLRSMDAARRNVQDGISLARTADGALGELSGLLIRMRELAVQNYTSLRTTSWEPSER